MNTANSLELLTPIQCRLNEKHVMSFNDIESIGTIRIGHEENIDITRLSKVVDVSSKRVIVLSESVLDRVGAQQIDDHLEHSDVLGEDEALGVRLGVDNLDETLDDALHFGRVALAFHANARQVKVVLVVVGRV